MMQKSMRIYYNMYDNKHTEKDLKNGAYIKKNAYI